MNDDDRRKSPLPSRASDCPYLGREGLDAIDRRLQSMYSEFEAEPKNIVGLERLLNVAARRDAIK
jgi:hypothetical protein